MKMHQVIRQLSCQREAGFDGLRTWNLAEGRPPKNTFLPHRTKSVRLTWNMTPVDEGVRAVCRRVNEVPHPGGNLQWLQPARLVLWICLTCRSNGVIVVEAWPTGFQSAWDLWEPDSGVIATVVVAPTQSCTGCEDRPSSSGSPRFSGHGEIGLTDLERSYHDVIHGLDETFCYPITAAKERAGGCTVVRYLPGPVESRFCNQDVVGVVSSARFRKDLAERPEVGYFRDGRFVWNPACVQGGGLIAVQVYRVSMKLASQRWSVRSCTDW